MLDHKFPPWTLGSRDNASGAAALSYKELIYAKFR